jgi:hypothetical protein
VGDDVGFDKWFEKYPRPQNSGKSRELWSKLSTGDREKCTGDLYRCLQKNPSMCPGSDVYIAREEFLAFKPGKSKVPFKAPTKEEIATEKKDKAELEERYKSSWDRVGKDDAPGENQTS